MKSRRLTGRLAVVIQPDPSSFAAWLQAAECPLRVHEASRRIGNFISGMTGRFALTKHRRLFDSTPDLR
jgi:dGTP triphosphohydrolase